VGALEIERRYISARIHFALAEQDLLVAAGNLLPHVLRAIERVAGLIDIDDVLPETLGHRNRDLRGLGLLLAGLLQQFLVALVARLGFGLAPLRRGRDPFLFALQRALMGDVLAAFLGQALLF